MNSTLDAPEGAGQIPQCLSEPNASGSSTDACSVALDAARYRWLADRFFGADFDWGHHIDEDGEQHSACVLLIKIDESTSVYGDLGATVDAAVKALGRQS